jgi:uncharacterized protein YjbJ (UPF0337 family)
LKRVVIEQHIKVPDVTARGVRSEETAVSLREGKSTMAMKDKAKNMLLISRGKLKQAAGSATHDKGLEANGRDDQRSGNLKQAGEKVKDAFRKH